MPADRIGVLCDPVTETGWAGAGGRVRDEQAFGQLADLVARGSLRLPVARYTRLSAAQETKAGLR